MSDRNDDSDEEFFALEEAIDFSDSVPGEFRGRVEENPQKLQSPQAPLYRVEETVYLRVQGQSQPAGPYIVTRIDENRRYTIKRKDNGQLHPQTVSEESLVIRTA